MTHTSLPGFLPCLAALAGCSGATAADVRGDYELVGPAFCEVNEPGQPLDVFSVEGSADVQEAPDTRPPDCEHLLWIRTEICPSCASEDCQLCLRDATADGTWLVGPGYNDSDGLDSCGFTDSRGGISSDLIVSAQRVSGTFGPAGAAPQIDITLDGTVRTGVLGTERAATIHCTFGTARMP
jgi:hypothetical protein